MVHLKTMTEKVFENFKIISQQEYAVNLAAVENISLEDALKSASDQFSKLASEGPQTSGQLFFEAIEEKSNECIGYLLLGIQDKFGRKVTSINDIIIKTSHRGRWLGKELMTCIEQESKKAGAHRIRLYVFQRNEVAQKLYRSMGFQVSSVDMFKLI